MLPPTGPLLALAVSAVGTWQAGVRSEVRGVAGAHQRQVLQLDLYEIDPLLDVGIENDSRRARLSASYAPRLLLTSPTGHFDQVNGLAGYHALSLAAGWRPDPRWTLSLGGTGSWGIREVSPLSQPLAEGAVADPRDPPPAPPPSSLQPNAGARQARFASTSVTGSAELQVSARWRLGATATVADGGGRGQAALTVFPRQRDTTVEVRARHDWTERDAVTWSLSGARNDVRDGSVAESAQIALRWDHMVMHRLTTFGGGGVTVTDSHGSDATPSRSAVVLPAAEAGIALAEPEQTPAPAPGTPRPDDVPAGPRAGWSGRAQARLAPYFDPYAGESLTRVEGLIRLGWRASTPFRIEGGAGGASAVTRSRFGPRLALLDVGSWWGFARNVEWGLTLRAGWQEAAPPPVPPWQWGVGVGLLWSTRRTP